jgi:hypothetical protein
MPDTQQRKKSAAHDDKPQEKSTGRRGSHVQPNPGRASSRGEKKRQSLQEKEGD